MDAGAAAVGLIGAALSGIGIGAIATEGMRGRRERTQHERERAESAEDSRKYRYGRYLFLVELATTHSAFGLNSPSTAVENARHNLEGLLEIQAELELVAPPDVIELMRGFYDAIHDYWRDVLSEPAWAPLSDATSFDLAQQAGALRARAKSSYEKFIADRASRLLAAMREDLANLDHDGSSNKTSDA